MCDKRTSRFQVVMQITTQIKKFLTIFFDGIGEIVGILRGQLPWWRSAVPSASS